MSVTMTEMIREVQVSTGFPRFNFLTVDEIKNRIIDRCIKDFTHYFPYKTIFVLYPDEDAVNPQMFPGLMKIVPKDAPIEKIYDTGMVYNSSNLAMGGYPRDLGRTVYGGGIGIGSVLYNQLNVNLMSMVQPQQTTGEFVGPNMIQLYPKRAFYGANNCVCIELLLYHADDLSTVPNSYEDFFRKLCILTIKHMIYERYKDWEDETVAGHQIRTKVQAWSDSEDKIEELKEKMDEECFKNPDRSDYFYIV